MNTARGRKRRWTVPLNDDLRWSRRLDNLIEMDLLKRIILDQLIRIGSSDQDWSTDRDWITGSVDRDWSANLDWISWLGLDQMIGIDQLVGIGSDDWYWISWSGLMDQLIGIGSADWDWISWLGLDQLIGIGSAERDWISWSTDWISWSGFGSANRDRIKLKLWGCVTHLSQAMRTVRKMEQQKLMLFSG